MHFKICVEHVCCWVNLFYKSPLSGAICSRHMYVFLISSTYRFLKPFHSTCTCDKPLPPHCKSHCRQGQSTLCIERALNLKNLPPREARRCAPIWCKNSDDMRYAPNRAINTQHTAWRRRSRQTKRTINIPKTDNISA